MAYIWILSPIFNQLKLAPCYVLRSPFSVLRSPFSVLRSPFSVLRSPFSVLYFLVCFTSTKLTSQDTAFVYTISNDIDRPRSFCDIFTLSITITNGTNASAFEGRVTIVNTNFKVVDISGLPDSYIVHDSVLTNVDYIYFTTPIIPSEEIRTYSYKLISKIYAADQYNIPHTITKKSNNHEGDAQILINPISKYRPIPFPGRNFKKASELLQDYADSLILTLYPLEGESPEILACNDLTSQSFYVEDSLIFDISGYCIYNLGFQGDIIVESGGIIIVEPGASVSIDNQYIRSCNAMWKGFYVKNGGTLSLYNCIIENAQYGIQAERGATINSTQTVFLNNHIGLYVSPFANQYNPEEPSSSYVNLQTFHNNLFIGTGAMLPAYQGQQPEPGDIPYAGIEANYVSSLVVPGDPAAGHANMFENLSNGIIARNSTMHVGNCFFKDIVKDPELALLQQGFGIHIQNGILTQVEGNTIGSFPPYTSHFDNVDVAIQSSGSHLSVRGMTIENCNKGIVVASTKNRNINIKENFISCNQKGIEIFPCIPTEGIIQENNIYIANQADIVSCIEVNDFPIRSNWDISNNYLSLDGAGYGILLRAGYDARIYDNTVDIASYTGSTSYGIKLEGSKNAQISCNLIEGTSSTVSAKKSVGIHATSSDRFNITCNETGDLSFGINFAGMNTGSRLRGNNFSNEHWDGLLLGRYPDDGNAVIGPQYHFGNTWMGNESDYMHFAAIHLGPSILVENSSFLIDSAFNNYVKPPSDSSATGWIDFEDDFDSTFVCNLDSLCLNGVGSFSDFTTWDSLDLELAQNNLGFEYFDHPLSWSGRLHVYHRLHDENLSNYPKHLVDFLKEEESQNIGYFSRSLDSLNTILKCSDSQEQILAGYAQVVSDKFMEYLFLDSIFVLDSANDSIADAKDQLLDSIAILGQDFHILDSIINIDIISRLDNLIEDIESIEADSTWEEMLQFTLLSSALLAKTDTLSASIEMFDLASVCPDRYSDAVFHARSLIRVDSLINYYDDSDLCTSLYPRSENPEKKPYPLYLYPNPASNSVTVKSEVAIAHVNIINAYGQQLQRIHSTGEDQMICNISALPAGFYYVVIRSNSGQSRYGSFIKVD